MQREESGETRLPYEITKQRHPPRRRFGRAWCRDVNEIFVAPSMYPQQWLQLLLRRFAAPTSPSPGKVALIYSPIVVYIRVFGVAAHGLHKLNKQVLG